MLTLNDGRKELYQWDTGRTATVDIDCDVIHFANLKYGESLAVEVKGGEVSIPNKLLMSGEQIYCWAFVQDESGAYTKKEQTFTVIKRAKPSDYVYTETETLTWKSLDERITELEKGGTGGSDVNGKDGATFIPTVSQEGIISWENDQGLQNPTPVNISGKSAYTYAVEVGYVGTEEEFAVKMAQEKFSNPNALTFTGAVTGSYDGSAPLEVEIPSGGGGTSGDYIPIPSSAEVGQTIVVKSVDENGKPTEWEAVDFPKWEKINEFSLTENALEVMIDADEDGNPFSLKKMMIAMDLPKLKNTSGENANTGYALYRINNVGLGYQNPSSDWDDGKFAWYLESMGDCIDVRCVKNTAWGSGNGSYFHVRTYKAGGFDGTIHSFLWSVFSPNIDKPSAMAGATFSVWGVRA